MRWSPVSNALGLVLVLVALTGISARQAPRTVAGATSLRAQFSTGTNPTVVDQGPSPAELEEQEEEDTGSPQEPEAVQLQQPDVVSSPPRSPAQVETFTSVERFAAPAPEAAAVLSLPPTPATENPTEPRISLTEVSRPVPASSMPSFPSLLADGVGGASLSQASKEANGDKQREAVADEATNADVGTSLRAFKGSVPPQKEPFPVTVPGVASPLAYGDAASAKTLFPPAVPASIASPLSTGASSLHAEEPKKSMPNKPKAEKPEGGYKDCNPPCIQGRGVCNDRMCFCKSPFTGTTCQHKVSTLARFPYAMLVGFSVVSLVLGVLLAQIVHAGITNHFEQRLAWLGGGHVKQEIWAPPENTKKPRG